MTRNDQWQSVAKYDWRRPAADLSEMLLAAFCDAFGSGPALPGVPAFVHLTAGLTALADWIGSDRQFFPFEAKVNSDYVERAQRQAKSALSSIGLDTSHLRPRSTAFAAISPHPMPNPAQAEIAAVDPAHPLVILEAETGSGKTEAALWRFARLFDAGVTSGLYFAVPTRAAARQLYRRVDAALQRLFGAAAPPRGTCHARATGGGRCCRTAPPRL
jgi:CRISPR-associated endonuclease/helicase Cas3